MFQMKLLATARAWAIFRSMQYRQSRSGSRRLPQKASKTTRARPALGEHFNGAGCHRVRSQTCTALSVHRRDPNIRSTRISYASCSSM
jgi:hypothetical protein